ncbi:hypothetical protein [Komagataeibacter saccharivorans]|uniref:hypothetical protein n=1 Tax=Komagataeibacter saccharivorans TaxID=265959 RepID=UPI0024A83E0B|nr:hypothetical protein [Komagataeibacter saccharivorans]
MSVASNASSRDIIAAGKVRENTHAHVKSAQTTLDFHSHLHPMCILRWILGTKKATRLGGFSSVFSDTYAWLRGHGLADTDTRWRSPFRGVTLT